MIGMSKDGRQRHFLRHLYIKCIILPRQARDKHRESTQKKRATMFSHPSDAQLEALDHDGDGKVPTDLFKRDDWI